jgi:hypothetical protein
VEESRIPAQAEHALQVHANEYMGQEDMVSSSNALLMSAFNRQHSLVLLCQQAVVLWQFTKLECCCAVSKHRTNSS